jgi:membrane-associated phospholipid phosphatase
MNGFNFDKQESRRIFVNNRFSDVKIPRPADLVTIGYQIFIIIAISFHFFAVPNPGFLLLYHLVIIAFLLWLPYAKTNRVIRWLRTFNPLIIIPTNFDELHYLVHNVNPVDFDELLIKIDYAIFGVHPTIWLEQFSNPILVEYLQIVYATFYFLPVILVVILCKRKEQENVNFFVYIIVLGFYMSYVTYFLVPAIGPRFTLEHLQINPVTGLWATQSIIDTLNFLESIQRDAFPSGHTEMTILTMIYAWKFSRKYFWVLSIIGTSLIFSTVFLRYHYAIDVVAGALLAYIVYLISEPLYQRLKGFSNKA